MHIKILAVFIGVVCLFAAITGCSDNAATTSPTPAQPQQSTAFNSYEELIANAVCNESMNGSVAYTALENANFICTVDAATGAWTWVLVQENIPQTEQPVQSGESNTQNCPNGILADGSCNNDGLPSNWNEYANGTAKEVEEGPGYVTDLRWGRNKTYRTTTIGNQVWMVEDVAVSGNCESGDACEGTWSVISDINTGFYSCTANIINCKLAFSQSIQGACPKGWHIPKESEWLILEPSLKNLSTQAVFSMSLWGDPGTGPTYFWTSSLASDSDDFWNFPSTSDGKIYSMRIKVVSFYETSNMVINGISIFDWNSGHITSETKARLRCVKD